MIFNNFPSYYNFVRFILSLRLTSPKQKARGKACGTCCIFQSILGTTFLYLPRNCMTIIVPASVPFAIRSRIYSSRCRRDTNWSLNGSDVTL